MATNITDGNLPPELFAEQQRIARRQQIADLMTRQGMTPVTSSNPRSPVSWTQGLAQMYSAYRGGQEGDAAAADQSKLYGRYQNLLADEVRRYMDSGQAKTVQPDPQEFEQSQDQGTATPQAATIPAKDARSRITEAMLSQNPMVRALGAKDYEALIKQSPNAMLGKIDPKDYTPESFTQFMTTGNAALLKPRVKKEINAATGQVYDPYAVEQRDIAADPNKPFTLGPDGKPVANDAFQRFELDKHERQAPKVSVNTADNPFLRGLGEEAAKAFSAKLSQAQGAVNTVRTVNQIRSALDTSDINVGPTTKAQMFLGRLAEKFGVAGADERERLGKARQVIQGLAQLELDAAQQMKGQGAITEPEREIIRRASAGDIDGMSTTELRTLLDVMDRSARYKIGSHRDQVAALKKNAGSNVSPMVLAPYDIDMPVPYAAPAKGRPAIDPRTQQLLDQFAPVPTP
jgi:hypothetical protein